MKNTVDFGVELKIIVGIYQDKVLSILLSLVLRKEVMESTIIDLMSEFIY